MQLTSESIEEQTQQALSNLKNVVDASGSSLSKVVKTTVTLRFCGLYTPSNVTTHTGIPQVDG
jgi:Endoribonuclease L-PSP